MGRPYRICMSDKCQNTWKEETTWLTFVQIDF
jgi:hypothetical protein